MGSLVPGQALIYERVDDVVYARYRDDPYRNIPRWVVGGYPEACERAVAKEQGDLFTYKDWQDINEMAKTNKALSRYLHKILDIYLLGNDTKKE